MTSLGWGCDFGACPSADGQDAMVLYWVGVFGAFGNEVAVCNLTRNTRYTPVTGSSIRKDKE
jgi:hypothetical protein